MQNYGIDQLPLAEETMSSAVTVWAIACAKLNTINAKETPAQQDIGPETATPVEDIKQDEAAPSKRKKKERRFSVVFFINGESAPGTKLSLRYAPMKMCQLAIEKSYEEKAANKDDIFTDK